MPEPVLRMWTIYYDALDFPGQYVARCFHIYPGEATPTQQVITGKTLDDLRVYLHSEGFVLIPRNDVDEEHIVETWI